MSDEPVRQAIAELQDVVLCICYEAYKDRGLQDPSCHCDSAEAVKVVSDRIEQLEAALKGTLAREAESQSRWEKREDAAYKRGLEYAAKIVRDRAAQELLRGICAEIEERDGE